ncbi:solute carrier organic anion transporter family member 74D-like [Uloborus diversus]|uniref:solute carrier organic anion transporter family member 74D-like n=1 Tax=Uloborus diversus TaxID=327109 RepID=UPI00240A2AEA|nr:solute carrier organic anion transporter family member 74D-like [Uloborus diversus]
MDKQLSATNKTEEKSGAQVTEMNIAESVEEMDEDTVCGIGNFHPGWMQRWATGRVYLALFSTIGVIQGMYYTYRIAVMTTLEKRFAFETKISGAIMMVDEITPLFFGLLIGYFGGKYHRPRMVTLGMMFSVACCFISAVPYFLYGISEKFSSSDENKENSEMCLKEAVDLCDSASKTPTIPAVLIFILASFLKGFANLAYHAIGLSYLDDSAKKKNAPIYLAIAHAMRLFGPALGYLLASTCLNYYEDPSVDPGFGPDDPRWIGAWWIGFIVQGVLLFICSLPIMFFPRRLPGKRHANLKKNAKENEGLKANLLGLLGAVKRLGTNSLYVLIVMNVTLSIYGGIGHSFTLPKYMEHQFRMSASDASLYSGPPTIAAVISSSVLGAILIWKYRPKAKNLIAGMALTEFLSAAFFLLFMIPYCGDIEMNSYGRDNNGLILTEECNANCNCSKSTYNPVCGPDGKTTYFSPCFAGCTVETTLLSKKVFTNCSCIAFQDGENGSFVTPGYCKEESCWSQATIYVVMLPVLHSAMNILRVAYTLICLRAIDPEDKSVALGTFEMLICLFGFIPFPVVVGSIVDTACLIWEETCGQTGNCWFYDVHMFRTLVHILSAFFQFLSALTLVVLCFKHSKLRDLYEEEDDVATEMQQYSPKLLKTTKDIET